jgi:Abnormal spindle-like microcephaly-assoc'd, ASPM-SPD-2-Hydin
MLSLATLAFTGLGTQTVTVTNSGSAALAITSIVASVNFTETDNCVGQSVAVGATCTINVSFVVATAFPSGSSGSVTITDNAADSPESISLSGPPVAYPGAVLLPMNIVFGGQPVGMSSSAQTVTLTNPPNGNGLVAPLIIARVTTNGDFIVQSLCPSSLASPGSCTISVSFTPMMSGMRTGALNFIDNANGVQGNIQIIPLSGTGQ